MAYASRGCRHLAIVGRRQKELQQVAELCREQNRKGEEWEMSDEAPGWETSKHDKVLAIQADCANVDDIVRIREECRKGRSYNIQQRQASF